MVFKKTEVDASGFVQRWPKRAGMDRCPGKGILITSLEMQKEVSPTGPMGWTGWAHPMQIQETDNQPTTVRWQQPGKARAEYRVPLLLRPRRGRENDEQECLLREDNTQEIKIYSVHVH